MKIKREFKIQRRPILACVTDDAELLAIVSDEMQISIYDLTSSPPKQRPDVILDSKPRAITISACGTVLAVAFDHGIDVSSLLPSALPSDRRSVKCDAVDSLAFSFDGTQLLGTTVSTSSPSTVVITAPYFDPGTLLSDGNIASMWTTSILFPNTSHDSSHAVLLQNGKVEEAAWAFTYDRSFEAFRAIRVEDLRNGTTYFTGPVPQANPSSALLPCTLPAATYRRQLVAAGFERKDVWVYGIPEDLDSVPGGAVSTGEHLTPGPALGRRTSQQSNVSRHSSSRGRGGLTPGTRTPQWQILCDRQRNNIVTGCKIAELDGLTSLNWVEGFGESSLKERLVATGRGVSGPVLATDEEDIDFVDGGRIVLIDFDYSLQEAVSSEITIELGTDDAEPLQEEKRDLETEVAIVRRRTVAQRRNNSSLARSTTSAGLTVPVPQITRLDDTVEDPLLPRRVGPNSAHHATVDVEEAADAPSIDEMEALDAPYAHASPRSGTTLRRAATAAAVNRALHPRTADGRPIEYRRADGRREHPHPADADNWVPPPPPYQADDPVDLPSFLRGPAVAPLASPTMQSNTWLARSNTLASTSSSQLRRQSRQRTASDSTTYSVRPRAEDWMRPRSSPSTPQEGFPALDPQAAAAVGQAVSEDNNTIRTDASLTSATGGLPAVLLDASEAAMGQAISRRTAAGEDGEERLSLTAQDIGHSNQMHMPSDGGPPLTDVRPLATARTWPLAPHIEPSPALSSESVQAQPGRTAAEDAVHSYPPAPHPEQLSRLHRHSTFDTGGTNAQASSSYASSSYTQPTLPWRVVSGTSQGAFDDGDGPNLHPNDEIPMIISTPRGLSGAFDAPEKSRYGNDHIQTTIIAPVPQRPRPNIPFNSRQQPVSVRPIYTQSDIAASQQQQQQQQRQQEQQDQVPKKGSLVPAWLSSDPAAGKSKLSLGLHRRPSRAERSAAKNIQDARKRGWKPKKGKGKAVSEDGEWTDVSTTTAPKNNKCVVM